MRGSKLSVSSARLIGSRCTTRVTVKEKGPPLNEVVELARIECDGFTISVLATETVEHGTKGIEILNGPEGDYIALVPYQLASTWSRKNKVAALTIIERMCTEVNRNSS